MQISQSEPVVRPEERPEERPRALAGVHMHARERAVSGAAVR